MDGDTPPPFEPLVPPDAPPDPFALQRRGIEMVAAANRLAFAWLQQGAAQHAHTTRRILDEMAETSRRLGAAGAPPDQARAAIEAMERAQALGLRTAEEIGRLMWQVQQDAVTLVETLAKGGDGKA